jgi:hypothetical protein
MVEELSKRGRRRCVTPGGTELIWHSDRLISKFGNKPQLSRPLQDHQNLYTRPFSKLDNLTICSVTVAYLCFYASQIHGLRIL